MWSHLLPVSFAVCTFRTKWGRSVEGVLNTPLGCSAIVQSSPVSKVSRKMNPSFQLDRGRIWSCAFCMFGNALHTTRLLLTGKGQLTCSYANNLLPHSVLTGVNPCQVQNLPAPDPELRMVYEFHGEMVFAIKVCGSTRIHCVFTSNSAIQVPQQECGWALTKACIIPVQACRDATLSNLM